jgi:hypothetical protein
LACDHWARAGEQVTDQPRHEPEGDKRWDGGDRDEKWRDHRIDPWSAAAWQWSGSDAQKASIRS